MINQPLTSASAVYDAVYISDDGTMITNLHDVTYDTAYNFIDDVYRHSRILNYVKPVNNYSHPSDTHGRMVIVNTLTEEIVFDTSSVN